VFSLCNAWVDIHNTIVGRSSASPRELIEYSVGVFKGAVPSVPELTALYSKAAGDSVVRRIEEVDFSLDGEIVGFEVAR